MPGRSVKGQVQSSSRVGNFLLSKGIQQRMRRTSLICFCNCHHIFLMSFSLMEREDQDWFSYVYLTRSQLDENWQSSSSCRLCTKYCMKANLQCDWIRSDFFANRRSVSKVSLPCSCPCELSSGQKCRKEASITYGLSTIPKISFLIELRWERLKDDAIKLLLCSYVKQDDNF